MLHYLIIETEVVVQGLGYIFWLFIKKKTTSLFSAIECFWWWGFDGILFGSKQFPIETFSFHSISLYYELLWAKIQRESF